MIPAAGLFCVGVAGLELDSGERAILQRHPPRAVILFRRNIESVDQVERLIGEIRLLPGAPLLCVDQEGGPVDRFRDALAPSVSFRAAAEKNLARRAGELAGRACSRLGFDVDLAPVVDRLVPGASERILQDRCASSDPAQIARAATEFLAGLQSFGIGGCVKHFPGLGRADLNTHKDLPRIPEDPSEEALDLAPFAATMEVAGAVMISHAAGPNGEPASLSPAKARTLLREKMGFSGASFSDDLEMGALAAFGDLPERCIAAARAGCDLLLVCSQISVYPECAMAVEREVSSARQIEAAARLDRYAARLAGIRGESSPAVRPLSDLIADIHALAAGETRKRS